ncbi:hypothetical protein EJ04DRAFT_564051 [Polyplosphaeria fusca]|uniref:Uncharacterized protein n=1 Tax=Polyplosphaeria fusca TaxID=682080 RepID=A0A9P4QY74_9PLEO|nr:hypothetical protein EJ04DRAFT_564051 [Polyplosphaeria fusca]
MLLRSATVNRALSRVKSIRATRSIRRPLRFEEINDSKASLAEPQADSPIKRSKSEAYLTRRPRPYTADPAAFVRPAPPPPPPPYTPRPLPTPTQLPRRTQSQRQSQRYMQSASTKSKRSFYGAQYFMEFLFPTNCTPSASQYML